MTTQELFTTADVLKSYSLIQAQDDENAQGKIKARNLRIAAAKMTYEACKVKGVTFLSIANAVKAKRQEIGESAAFANDMAYGSETMVGYVSTAGMLLSLPGNLPEEAVIGRIAMDVKEIGQDTAKLILRRKGMTQDKAYYDFRTRAQTIIDGKKTPKTAEELLKLITKPLDKVLAMELDGAARDLLALMVMNIQAVLGTDSEQTTLENELAKLNELAEVA